MANSSTNAAPELLEGLAAFLGRKCLFALLQGAERKGGSLEVILVGGKLPSLRTQDHTGSFPLLHFKQQSTSSRSVSVGVFAAFFNLSCAANIAWVSADTDA